MKKDLQEMFQKSNFGISNEKYVYVKVSKLPQKLDHFMITQFQGDGSLLA